jgi:hypothetical protein
VDVDVSVGRGIGREVAVEEGRIAGVESDAGLFVPQAFKINIVLSMNQ